MKKEYRSKKRAYLNDFKKNSEGRYEYQGKIFECKGGKVQLTRVKYRMWMAYAFVIICAIAGGCIPAPGLVDTFYVILPYALGLMAAISLGWALCRLSCAGDQLKAYIYDVTVKKIPHRAVLTIILNTASVIGMLIYLLVHREDSGIAWCIIFVVLELIVCVGAVGVFKIAGKLEWTCFSSDKAPDNEKKSGKKEL